MRHTRTIGPLVALILAATLGATATSPTAAAGGKPKHAHDLVAKGKVGETNKFVVQGRVATLPSGTVKVLRNVAGGKYTVWKKTSTSNRQVPDRIYQVGRKKHLLQGPGARDGGYRKTTSPNMGCIHTA